MDINMERKGNELTVTLEGRLNTLTAPELEEKLESSMEGLEKLIFDFEKLEYISSAGLRVMLTTMQIMEGKGKMIVRNPSETVMNVFEITGFIDDLIIE
ncbi:MAG: STAS domain-containing protein [Lachnospiraceae bacterium]|nr:STAS domain-containing protein [Lachnospiraceae bacterium]